MKRQYKKNPEGVTFKKAPVDPEISGDDPWDATFDGYDVYYRGEKIGTVMLNDSVPSGYWGRWTSRRGLSLITGDSRRDVATQMVKYLTKKNA